MSAVETGQKIDPIEGLFGDDLAENPSVCRGGLEQIAGAPGLRICTIGFRGHFGKHLCLRFHIEEFNHVWIHFSPLKIKR